MTQQKNAALPSYQKELEDCSSIYTNIIRTIKKQPGYVVDFRLLDKAYQTARDLHGDTRRRSGVLYLRHPLAVMEELSRLMCKTSILAAALLHDTMEDCGISYESLRQEFSYEIAEIVSAVSAIKAGEASADRYFSTLPPEKQHEFLDSLTDAKLISSPYQREAFLVRFADRAHNLSTIDACPPGKRKEKIASTRQFLIPAAKRLGMHYFEITLSDWCMKFDGEDYTINESAQLLRRRNALTRVGGSINSRFDQHLQDAVESQSVFSFPRFNPFAKLRGVKRDGTDSMQAVQRRILLAYELKQQLAPPHCFERSSLDLWEIILVSSLSQPAAMLHHFIALHREHLKDKGIFLEYLGQQGEGVLLRLTDRYENNYRVLLLPQSRLAAHFTGDPNGEQLALINTEAPNDALRPQITVYSYSPAKGYTQRRIPSGATALDFAFIISPSLAHTVKCARIHTWPGTQDGPPFLDTDYRYPLGTVLREGDTVHFDADYFPGKHSDGDCSAPASIPHVVFDWFSDVNTEYAKNCLIRYFKDKYAQ